MGLGVWDKIQILLSGLDEYGYRYGLLEIDMV